MQPFGTDDRSFCIAPRHQHAGVNGAQMNGLWNGNGVQQRGANGGSVRPLVPGLSFTSDSSYSDESVVRPLSVYRLSRLTIHRDPVHDRPCYEE
jgi:hypothetical protein